MPHPDLPSGPRFSCIQLPTMSAANSSWLCFALKFSFYWRKLPRPKWQPLWGEIHTVAGWYGATNAWSPMPLLSPSPYRSVLWSEVAVASSSKIPLCPNLLPLFPHRDGSWEHSPVKLLHAHFRVSECFSGTRTETVSYWTPLSFCSFTYKREMIIANMSEITVGIKWDNACKLCGKLLDTHLALKGTCF